ncbi:MAG: hypothetical protein AB1782_16945 [Cyanobacteriota bacterium]
MQPAQYLILAREINRNEHGIFSFQDICQHLAVNELPAKGKFDMAILCGPNWESGKYRIHIATQLNQDPPNKIGYADVEIADNAHIYTAVVKNLGLIVDSDQGFSFQVYKQNGPVEDTEENKNGLHGELILVRPFKVKLVQKQPQ